MFCQKGNILQVLTFLTRNLVKLDFRMCILHDFLFEHAIVAYALMWRDLHSSATVLDILCVMHFLPCEHFIRFTLVRSLPL